MEQAQVESAANTTFAQRLRELIGETPVSAFARRVGISEGLMRKYLSGSEPSLSKANQIARNSNCSLEWLATGGGYRYRQAEVVDMAALEQAIKLGFEVIGASDLSITDERAMKLVVALYQYLRATKKPDGHFDVDATREFSRYLGGLCAA